MIISENGVLHIKGTKKEVLIDAIAIVYSVRQEMKNYPNWVADFDSNIKAILANDFDDHVANFRVFDAKTVFDAFKSKFDAEQNKQQSKSCAEDLMRDITEEQD